MYRLISLYLYLTDNCNLRCRHCWIDPECSDSCEKEPVSVSVLEKAIVEAKELGLGRVKLTGGEPLLREDIADIIEMLDKYGMVVDIESNGTLITSDIAKKISEVRKGTVSISLDSFDPDYHDAFRGAKGAFSKTLDGAERLRENKVPFQVISSVSRENISHLEKTVKLASEIKASSFKVNPITPFGRGEEFHENNINLSVPEILELKDNISVYSDKYRLEIFMSIPPVFRPLKAFHNNNLGRCHVLNILGVMCDGTVSFCGVGKKEKELIMGNIRSDSIKDIWENSPVLKRMREEIPDKFEGLCGRCIFKGFCLGECVAITYGKTKSFTKTYWFCEMAEKEGLFPVERLV